MNKNTSIQTIVAQQIKINKQQEDDKNNRFKTKLIENKS